MDQIDRPVVEGAQGILDINWMTERIAVGGWVETDEKMQAAAKGENYEEAARLRDLIRQKEASDEPG